MRQDILYGSQLPQIANPSDPLSRAEGLIRSRTQPQDDSATQAFLQQDFQGPLRQSALNVVDRFRYGFADDWGKRQIIMQAGHHPDNIVSLQNGEYGVKTEKGIKPVDPKGFQLSDIGGDIAETIGTMPAIIGQMLGAKAGALAGGVGAIPGAGIGAAGGEAISQAIGEHVLGVRESADTGRILTAGAFGAAGQGVAMGAGKLLSSLTKAGSAPAAHVSGGMGKPPPTSVSNVITKQLGMKNTNSKVIERALANKNTYVTEHLDKLANQVDTGMEKLLVNKDKILYDKILRPGLLKEAARQGVRNTDDVLISNVPAKKALSKLLKATEKKVLTQSTKDELVGIIKGNQGMIKGTKQMTMGQYKQTLQDIFAAKEKALTQGDKIQAGVYDKIYKSFAGSRDMALKKTVPADQFRQYSTARRELGKLDEIMRMKISPTDAQELASVGQGPAGRISRLTSDVKFGRNYDALYRTLEKAKQYGIEGAEQTIDNVDNFMLNFALSKAKYQPTAFGRVVGSTPFVGTTAREVMAPAFNPYTQAKMLFGARNLGMINPSGAGAKVSERFLPRTNSLMNLLNKGTAPNSAQAIKTLPKSLRAVAKAANESKTAVVSQSLNRILYGE